MGDKARGDGDGEGQVWVVRHTRAVRPGGPKDGKARKKKSIAPRYTIDDRDDVEYMPAEGQAPKRQTTYENDADAQSEEGDIEIDDPEEYVQHQVLKLAYWEEPAFSSLGLSMVVLIFCLVHYSEYSVLTLLSFMILFQLTLSAITVNFTPVLRDAKIVNRHFTAERFVEQRRLVPASEIEKLSKGLGMYAGSWMESLEEVMFFTDDLVAVGALVAAIVFIMVLNINYEAYILLAGACVAFFTLPPLYNVNREYIQDVVFAGSSSSGAGRRRRKARASSASSGSDLSEVSC
ncbi:Hypothetical Protein FCC1311_067492 [Hondaea fermentalgiana]|uniref:Reticulon-like protein n=1 Tax=Hondaea fermentalgiana TaxID=2315210 RepID=A0A2R5GJM8_9STRA|nr:Hypothetical Protein FCC1311_067492 [Hondaea fermentalgiana]|eukprot:GBG30529.1 Hypothetical Protein FCC1311_067492 [Hondaea fermentalgiana]